MRNNRGFTLVELIIGLGLVTMVGFAFSYFFKGVSDETKKIQKKISVTQNSNLIEKYLMQYAPSGNIRFFSFNSDGNRIRSFYPMPKRCADMSLHAECKEDTSLLYVKYAKTTTAAVSTICRLSPAAGEANPDYLIDLKNETYGSGAPNAQGFKITATGSASLFASGQVEVTQDKMLAVFSPPFAYIYKVVSSPVAYHPVQAPNLESFPGHPELNHDCINNLQVSNVTGNVREFNVTSLYRVKLIPLFLSELATGPTGPDPANTYSPSKDFPMRTFNVKFETFGKINIAGKWVFSINQCFFVGPNLTCPTPVISQLAGAKRLRIDFNYKISLRDLAGNIKNKDTTYEVITSEQTPSCVSITEPTCPAVPLVITTADQIPYLITGSETSSNLFAEGFSMLKQDELKSIRFRFQIDSSNKERMIYVFLP